jgi:hypothetical protein
MVQPVTNPGTISVPMSSIVDALKGVLQGVLSADEQTALFDKLGLSPGVVEPGDLITAELFNQMLSDINDLSIRLAALEGSAGGPVLESLDPSSTVEVTKLLIVTGRNFNHEPNFNIVKIGNVDITQFREESSETHLIFAVPDMFANLPQTLPVRVETGGRTSNVMQIKVVAENKAQKGNFAIGPAQTPPGNVLANTPVAISWDVQAITMFDDNVALALMVSNAVGVTASAWLNGLVFQPAAPMAILAGKTKKVTATVKVPVGATSAKLQLKVTSSDGNVSNISDPVEIKLGDAVKTSSAKNQMAMTVIGAGLTKAKVTMDGSEGDGATVKKSPTEKGSVKITVTDNRQAADGQAKINFAFKAEFVTAAPGLIISPDFSPKAVADVPFGDDRSFFVPLDASAAAVGATAKLKVTITQTSTADATKVFTSWLEIPLKVIA